MRSLVLVSFNQMKNISLINAWKIRVINTLVAYFSNDTGSVSARERSFEELSFHFLSKIQTRYSYDTLSVDHIGYIFFKSYHTWKFVIRSKITRSFLLSTQQQINISIRPRTSVDTILVRYFICYAHVHGPTRY